MKASEPNPQGEGDTRLSCMRSDSAAVTKTTFEDGVKN